MYIAVVKRDTASSTGRGGTWTSFTGPDRDEVTRRGLDHLSRITRTGNYAASTYHVEVGELIWRAESPVSYVLVPLTV